MKIEDIFRPFRPSTQRLEPQTFVRDNQCPRALDSIYGTRPICRNPSATRHMKREILAIKLRLRLKRLSLG